jgi:hypothetical protein
VRSVFLLLEGRFLTNILVPRVKSRKWTEDIVNVPDTPFNAGLCWIAAFLMLSKYGIKHEGLLQREMI